MAWVRIGALNDDLAGRLIEGLHSANLWLDIGGATFQVDAARAVVRSTPYGVLAAQSTPSGSGEIGLRFVSPTTFNTPGRSFLFPLPSAVFGGLGTKWSRFADCALPGSPGSTAGAPSPDFDAALDVSRYSLETTKLTFRHEGTEFPLRAFLGSCRFMPAKGACPAAAAAARVLAHYAEFAGVGSYTTAGLGRVERIR